MFGYVFLSSKSFSGPPELDFIYFLRHVKCGKATQEHLTRFDEACSGLSRQLTMMWDTALPSQSSEVFRGTYRKPNFFQAWDLLHCWSGKRKKSRMNRVPLHFRLRVPCFSASCWMWESRGQENSSLLTRDKVRRRAASVVHYGIFVNKEYIYNGRCEYLINLSISFVNDVVYAKHLSHAFNKERCLKLTNNTFKFSLLVGLEIFLSQVSMQTVLLHDRQKVFGVWASLVYFKRLNTSVI